MMRIVICLIIAVTLSAICPSIAAATPSLSASVDRDTIRIGDPIVLTLTLVSSADEPATFPDFPGDSDDVGLELLEMAPVESNIVDGVRTETLRFTLSSYETGEFSIPPFVPDHGGEATAAIPITVVSVGLGDDLRTVRDPAAPPRNWWLTLWPYLAAAAIAGIITWLIRRRSQRTILPDPVLAEVDLRPAHVIAYEQVEAIERGWIEAAGDGDRKRLSFFHLSLALREYLRNRYAFPAPERTTREILRGIRGERLPSNATGLLRDLLDQCDLIKFRGDLPDDEAFASVTTAARNFIEETRESRDEGDVEGVA